MSTATGHWIVDIQFLRGQARHAVQLEQDGDQISGRYRTQYAQYPVTGAVTDGGAIVLHVPVSHEHVGVGYGFHGTLSGDAMCGQLNLGEYWTASWSASKREAP